MIQRRLSLTILALNIMMLLFAASAVLSLRASYDPALSQQPVLAMVESVGLYFVVAYLARRHSRSRLIGGEGILIAAGVALVFITQFKYYSYPETTGILRQLATLTSFLPNLQLGYIHPNGAATFLEMALPISIALAVSTQRTRLRWLWIVCALIMLYAILLSASRGAWIGLVLAGMIGFAVVQIRKLPRGWAILMIVGAAALLVGLVVVAIHNNLLTSEMAAVSSRLDLYRNSLYLIRDYAFTGIGPGGTFAMVYSRYGLLIFVPFLTYSHNLPLAVWFGQGLPGIASFIGMVVFFYAYVYQVIKRAEPGGLFYGAWLGVTATLLHGLDDARQYTESPWVMPALFFGIGLAVACGARALKLFEDSQQEAGIMPPPRSWRGPIAIIGLCVLLMVGAVIGRKTLEAMWDTNLGALDETRADKFIAPDMDETERAALENSAQDYYQKALAISPNLSSANRRLGTLLVGQDQYADAVPLLEKAVAQESTNSAAIKGLGLAYVWVGRIDDAVATLKQLKDQHSITEELGTWHQYRTDQGRPLLAAYALETDILLTNQPTPNLDVWLLLADDYRNGGDPERARKWYQAVLEQDANNQRARDGLAVLGS